MILNSVQTTLPADVFIVVTVVIDIDVYVIVAIFITSVGWRR